MVESYITVEQAAARLNLSKSRVRQLLHEQKIQGIKHKLGTREEVADPKG